MLLRVQTIVQKLVFVSIVSLLSFLSADSLLLSDHSPYARLAACSRYDAHLSSHST